MSISLAVASTYRRALFVAALLAAPALVSAQGRTAASARVEAVVVTVASIRVRTAPSQTSLSIDEFTQGTVFPLAPDEYQTNDWYAVMLDGRLAYLPRNAAAPRARGSRAVIAAPVEVASVTQAGAPAAPAPATAVERAPELVASRPAPAPMPAERSMTPASAPVAAAPAPAPTPAAMATQRVADQPIASAPAAAPATQAETPAPPTAERKADQPNFSARRAGMNVTVGVLGSVTPIKASNGLTPSAHVAGVSFLGVRYRAIGLYGAPEYGQGGGYRSTMLGGGLSLDLVNLHLLRVTALGGYTTYAETTMPTDTTVAPVTAKLQGPSVGGMASIPFFGPLRLAYRGQYVMAQVAGVPARMTRHYVGLVF
jgi:hypothetical protein